MRAKPPPKKKNPLDLTIQFGRGVGIAPLTQARVRTLLSAALESGFSITVRFVGRAEAQALNRSYRGRRYTPNVLTFSYAPQAAADIVICTPIVREQARAQSKSFADHLTHLLIHGCLHAQGYDHDKPKSAASMEARERVLLAAFGIADPYR